MNGDPYKYVTEQQVRDDLHAAMAQDFAALHPPKREPEHYAPKGLAVGIVYAAAAGTCMGVAVAIVEWVL